MKKSNLWELLKGKLLELHILITPDCNFDCEYCVAGNLMKQTQDFLRKMGKDQAEKWKSKFREGVLRMIDAYPGEEILFSGGEPLITTALDKYPYLGEYISRAAKLKNLRTIRILTNGFSIPSEKEEAFQFFKKLVDYAGRKGIQLEFSEDPEKIRQYMEGSQKGLLQKKIGYAKEFSKENKQFDYNIQSMGKKHNDLNKYIENKISWNRKRKVFLPIGKGAEYDTGIEDWSGRGNYPRGTLAQPYLSIPKIEKNLEYPVKLIVRPDGLVVPDQVLAYIKPPRFVVLGNILKDSPNDIIRRLYNIANYDFQEELHHKAPKEFPPPSGNTGRWDKFIDRLRGPEHWRDGYWGYNQYLDHVSEKSREALLNHAVKEYLAGINNYKNKESLHYYRVTLTVRNRGIREHLDMLKKGEMRSPLMFFVARLVEYKSVLREYYQILQPNFKTKLMTRMKIKRERDIIGEDVKIILKTLEWAGLKEKTVEYLAHCERMEEAWTSKITIPEVHLGELPCYLGSEESMERYLKALMILVKEQKNKELEKIVAREIRAGQKDD